MKATTKKSVKKGAGASAPKSSAEQDTDPRRASVRALKRWATIVRPPDPALVSLMRQSVSAQTLMRLGTRVRSDELLALLPSFVELQWNAAKKLSPAERAHFVGWSEELLSQLVHEGLKLAALLDEFERAAQREQALQPARERYKHVRLEAIALRDRAVSVLRTLSAPESVPRTRLKALKLRSDSADALAQGLREVSEIIEAWLTASSATQRMALAAMQVDEALVERLRATAQRVLEAGRIATSETSAVEQSRLDEQDGVVLLLLRATARAWAAGRKQVPSVPMPRMGSLRSLLTKTKKKRKAAPTPPA
jgi:hypothetical protein